MLLVCAPPRAVPNAESLGSRTAYLAFVARLFTLCPAITGPRPTFAALAASLLWRCTVDDYLDRRGRGAEGLFAFRRERSLALIIGPTFLSGVRLEAEADGAVRCRVGGKPTALVQVSDQLHLDLFTLAAGWPRWMAELVERVGEPSARALVSMPPIVERVESARDVRLPELILEHSIRAEHLYVLGERRDPMRPRVLEGELRFELRFPRGTLELTYTSAGYEDAQARTAEERFVPRELEVEVRWRGASIVLPRSSELEWRGADLVELLIVASAIIEERPSEVAALCEAVVPMEASELDALALGSVLNLWGVALRKTGDAAAAVRVLRKALELAERAGPELEQQVLYNLGYAMLQTTMKSRHRAGSTEGAGRYTALYDVAERHRATWIECQALFERALELAPSDATARSQVEQTRLLLGALDAGARAEAPTSATPPPADERLRFGDWAPAPIVLSIIVLVLAVLWLSGEIPLPREVRPPAARPAPGSPLAPDTRDLPRIEALERLDPSALPEGSALACPIAVALPREVPSGTVVAPRLGRSVTGALYGTEHFDATIRHYTALYAPDTEVRPASPEGIGPVMGSGEPPIGGRGARAVTTMLVTDWRDPIVLEGGASIVPGRLGARLLVWSREEARFVCAADVVVENGSSLSIVRASHRDGLQREDDPLNRARLDLIERALQVGIPRLTAVAAAAPAEMR